MLIALSLLACSGCNPTQDTGDSGKDTDTGGPDDVGALITPGPALGDCSPHEGGQGVALSGVLLLESGPEFGVVHFVDGEIQCVGDCDTDQAKLVCTEGVIGAGVIDAHDHMQYNTLPPWRIGPEFTDRYDWRSDGRYYDYKSAYTEISNTYACEIMRWAESRVLMGGGTSAVGVYYNSCILGGVRNLDESESAHGIEGYSLNYSSRTVTSSLDTQDGADYAQEIQSGELTLDADHVAEGWDSSVGKEVDHMHDIGMSGPGFVYVHATDASTAQLAAMASEGTGIIWSPRSNLSLYGGTTQAKVAMTLGVPIALGPDWTPSGSHTPKNELVCADDWLLSTGTPVSDMQIWAMGTSQAAKVLGLAGRIGSLEPGAKADLVVFPFSDTPYRGALDAGPDEIQLVVVDGQARFGAPDLVSAVGSDQTCEDIDVCGSSRRACLRWDVASTESTLVQALAGIQMPNQGLDYAAELLGLFQCEADPRGACVPLEGADDDPDADGLVAGDSCPDAWNPRQLDHDGDGIGDVCDPCPLLPDADDCRHDPTDIDDDGVLYDKDICPVHYDPDQLDSDADGHGDACDACPQDPNPGDAGCPFGVEAIQDESHPEHPDEGERLSLSGMVVTGVRGGSNGGFFVQDPELADNAGVYVYDKGKAGVSVGDQVTVVGTYLEYNGLAELESPDVQITGTGSITPLPVSACEVATGGAKAEALESMLVVVSDVSVSDPNPDDPDDYGAFEVEGCLWVDDTLTDTYETHPAQHTTFSSITGPMQYAYSQRRILPRSPDDLQ